MPSNTPDLLTNRAVAPEIMASAMGIQDPLGQAQVYAVRYPADLGKDPYEKWMLFEVKSARHILRTGLMAEDGDKKDSTIKAVALYLPPDALSSTLGVTWGEGDVGQTLGAALAGAIQKGRELDSGPASTLGLNTLLPALEAGFRAGAVGSARTGITNLAGALGGFLGKGAGVSGETAEKAMAAITGSVANPRTDMFFESVAYRSHTFTFVMVPRNLTEAQAIDAILNTFQFYMLPSFGGEEDIDSAFIGFPYEFEISMFTQHNGSSHHINTVDRSVLTSININHSSNENVAFVDRQGGREYYPASTSITLEFTEVRLQGRNQQSVIWRGTNRKWDQEQYPDKRSGPGMEQEGGILATAIENVFQGGVDLLGQVVNEEVNQSIGKD